jgi:hypothetical protein
MFHILKLLFYAAIIGVIVFVVWFLPKYDFIKKNPGFCTEIGKNFYYCGSAADLKNLFTK